MPARLAPPLFVALLAATLVVGAPTAAAGRDRCAPKGAKKVKQNTQVRVFTLKRRDVTIYYGCLRSSGRRVRVGQESSDPESLSHENVITVSVAGTSVAVQGTSFDDIGPEGEDSARLVVADLRQGGRIYRVSVSANSDSQYAGFATVLLRRDGAAAWVLGGQGDYDEVDVLGATARKPTPVAYAKGIDEESLEFGGEGVTWVQGGVTRTAAIP